MNLQRLRTAIDAMERPTPKELAAARACLDSVPPIDDHTHVDDFVRLLEGRWTVYHYARREYALAILIEAEDAVEFKRRGWKGRQLRDRNTIDAGRSYRRYREALRYLREEAAERLRMLRADVVRLDNARTPPRTP